MWPSIRHNGSLLLLKCYGYSHDPPLHSRVARDSKAVLIFTWGVLLPFSTVWTVTGSVWLGEILDQTPKCLAKGTTSVWFVLLWQVLCYIWLLIYFVFAGVALALELRTRRAEALLRSVETEDSLQRWGRPSLIPEWDGGFGFNFWSLGPSGQEERGMSPTEIEALPCTVLNHENEVRIASDSCSIILVHGDAFLKERRIIFAHTSDCKATDLLEFYRRNFASSPGLSRSLTFPLRLG